MVVPPLQSLPVHRPPVNTDNTASVGSYDTVATVTVATTASDDSGNTAAVSNDVALSADTTAAGTTIISADSDNTASVSSDVAPSAHATAAGTTIVSDDSDNPCHLVVMMLELLGLEGSQTRQLVTDDSDNATPAGGDTAIAAGSRGFSDPADRY